MVLAKAIEKSPTETLWRKNGNLKRQVEWENYTLTYVVVMSVMTAGSETLSLPVRTGTITKRPICRFFKGGRRGHFGRL